MIASLALAVLGAAALGFGLWSRARSRIEASLTRREKRVALLLDQLHDAILFLDPTGRIVDVNRRAEELYGYSRDELLVRNVRDLCAAGAPDDPRRQTSQGGHARDVVFETVHVNRCGERIPVEVSRSHAETEEQGPIVEIIRDVRDRRTIEEALRSSERELRTLLENSPDVIARFAPDGRHLYVNQAIERATLLRRDAFFGKTHRELGFPEHVCRHWEDRIRMVCESARPIETEFAFEGPAEPILLDWRWTPERGDNGEVASVLCVGRNVTAQRRAETSLKQAQSQMMQAQKLEAVGRLAGGVAHDFNNILGIITGFGELALRDLPGGHPARRRLTTMLSAAEKAAALIRQLLLFGQRQPAGARPAPLNRLIGELVPMLRRLIREDVRLDTRLSANVDSLQGDPTQIEQVIVNLILNARDALPHGGSIVVSTSVVTSSIGVPCISSTAPPGEYVVLEVKDTGCGMDSDTLERVFDPFFTTKPPGKGSGLGLSTMHGIVARMGGHVWVESTPGKGSVFRLLFPKRDVESPATLAPLTLEAVSAGGTETIMVVEDEETLREIIVESLSGYGYSLVPASSGPEAIAIAKKHPHRIDLLLTDVVMPDMNGKDLADRMRETYPGIRVLFMSGYTDDTIERYEIEQGTVKFIEKPFTVETLSRKVRETLEESGPDTPDRLAGGGVNSL